MAATFPVFLLFCAVLFTVTVAFEYCGTDTSKRDYIICDHKWDGSVLEFCCGTCDNKYCCSDPQKRLTSDAQIDCLNESLNKIRKALEPPHDSDDTVTIVITLTVVGAVILIKLFILCWVCPCCCLYKKCRNPRPTTTVVTTQFLPTIIRGSQYPPYQPLPNQPEHCNQPAYGGQHMATGPFQGRPYVPGLPPPYQEAGSGYPLPYSQAGYDGGQATYPAQPPAQLGFAHQPTDYTSPQPAYNLAYMES
ncbi:protein shisa-5-like isoform X2 [Myxocyprinus asiaticus]|uniref:protein shisa-5-like isoform X2 n=1 Tax=Myxocyprinus asiaticus TaxID=70543 RepID=UPI0022238A17|nr:protein shisa-5-like isoform X2 [Myxocyprinus asiaticus]